MFYTPDGEPISASEVRNLMPARSCENPVLAKSSRVADRPYREVPCGRCYYCRRKVVRAWQGRGILEQRYPYYPEHASSEYQHFFTLTYAKTPHTDPVPNELGFVYDDTGKRVPWVGPFFQGRRKGIRKDPDGNLYYDETPLESRNYDPRPKAVLEALGLPSKDILPPRKWRRYLEPADFAYEHGQFLLNKCGWSDEQLSLWLKGDYSPMPTLRIADFQKFMKRLRVTWQRRSGEEDVRLRYIASGEYGGALNRPHYHLSLFGLPKEFATLVHDCWEDYSNPGTDTVNGHVHPSRDETVHGASLMRGRAATYQAKDLVKSVHSWLHNPAVIAVERPRVIGSKNPAIGDGAYPWWFDNWIHKRVIPKAEARATKEGLKGRARERFVVRVIRENYGIINLQLNGRTESFPSTQLWRDRVKKDLAIDPLLWDEITVEDQHRDVKLTEAIQNDGKIGKLVDDYRSERKAKSRAIESRERERIKKKRSELLAAGKLRSE